MFMAQMALPHVKDRVLVATCCECGKAAFDVGDDAFTPQVGRTCRDCGGSLYSIGPYRKVLSNPFVGTLSAMSISAVRPPQQHDLGLIPETL